MLREALTVGTDPHNSQMRDRLRALAAAWRTYREQRELQTVRSVKRAQERRIRAMSDDELISCAAQWGGAMCWPEMRRRGLPVPQGVTHA